MHPIWELWILLLLIYGSECFVWVSDGDLVVTKSFAKSRVCLPIGWLSNHRGGLAFSGFWPFQMLWRVPFWEASFGAGGVSSYVPLSLPAMAHSKVRRCHCSKIDQSKVTRRSERVTLCESCYIETSHESRAKGMAELARHYAAKNGSDLVIKKWMAKRLKPRIAATRIDQVFEHSKSLSWLTTLEFVFLFVVFPSLFALGAPLIVWLSLCALFVALHIIVIVVFVTQYRRLHPKLAWPARSLFIMIIAPTYAMRATSILSVNSLETHPVTLLDALGEKQQAEGMLIKLIRDAKNPVANESNPEADVIEKTFVKMVLEAYLKMAAALGVDAAEADKAPPVEGGASHYCPRCHAQFRQSLSCHHCQGLPTQVFGN